jgi:isocitrate/isopropylmalate dehydrogenase
MPEPLRIVVLGGDETGQELLEQALRVLDGDVCGVGLELEHHDLSLERRRATSNGCVTDAAAAMREGQVSGSRQPPSPRRAPTTSARPTGSCARRWTAR